jgi:hypothetical protein
LSKKRGTYLIFILKKHVIVLVIMNISTKKVTVNEEEAHFFNNCKKLNNSSGDNLKVNVGCKPTKRYL